MNRRHSLAIRVKRNLVDSRHLLDEILAPQTGFSSGHGQRALGWVADHAVGDAVEFLAAGFQPGIVA